MLLMMLLVPLLFTGGAIALIVWAVMRLGSEVGAGSLLLATAVHIVEPHIPHVQTSTIGIIYSCLQPVFVALGLYLGDQDVL